MVPLLLGASWSLDLGPLFVGKAFMFLSSLAIIVLLYDITRRLFHERAGLIAAALFSFSAIFFQLGLHVLTELPSVLLLLVSVNLILRRRYMLSGLFFSLSVLTKYSMLVMALGFLAYFVYMRKDMLKSLSVFSLGAGILLVPFLVINALIYPSPFFPLTEASRVIRQVIGCNYLYFHPWYFYLAMVLRENILYLAAPFGIAWTKRLSRSRKYMLLFLLFVPLLYFTQLRCRDYRYLLTFLPFVTIFASTALDRLTKKVPEKVFIVLLFTLLLLSAGLGLSYYYRYEPWTAEEPSGYFTYLADRAAEGEVWVSDPRVTLHTDKRLHLLYYPVFNAELAEQWTTHFKQNKESVSFIMVDSCGGGLSCLADDAVCWQKKLALQEALEEYPVVFREYKEDCSYEIFST
jgi:hypothetical protein